MSNTKYSGQYLLRMDAVERATLATAVMREIEAVSQVVVPGDPEHEAARHHLLRLRSLLERLTD